MTTKLQVSTTEYKKLSDEELIHRFAFRQDKNAANYIFERYGHIVYGVCIKYFSDTTTAKEHTQQIFIKLFDDLPRFHISNFKAWLAKVCRNHCLMELRKKKPEIHTDFLGYADMETGDELHQKIEQEKLFNYLEASINELNKEQQKCIKLFYLKKMTYAEITAATGYSFKEVKSYIQNAKRNLKINMERFAQQGI